MDIQRYLQDTFRFVKEEPFILLGWSFLLQMTFIISQGFGVIIAGPLLGGYYLLTIAYLRDRKKPSLKDLFKGFEDFGRLFPFFFVLLIKAIGFIMLILPGVLFATWWIYVLPLMVDRRLSFSDAMKLSTKKVNETGFLMHFVFLILVNVIPLILLNILFLISPLLSILSIFLLPIQAGCLAGLYLDKFNEPEIYTESDRHHEPAEDVSFMPSAKVIAGSPDSEDDRAASQEKKAGAKDGERSELSAGESLKEGNIPDTKPFQGIDSEPNPKEEELDQNADKDNKNTV